MSTNRHIRGLTGTDVLVVVAIVAVTIAVLVFSLARNRDLTRREACVRNLKALGVAVYTYADSNADDWPVAAHPAPVDGRTGSVDYVQAIGSYRGKAGEPDAGNTARMSPLPTKQSTTRNLWILFRLGYVARSEFVCPSTMDQPNNERNARDYWDFGLGDIAGPATPVQSRQGYRQVSYGYQVPYGKHARPNSDMDCRMVVMAEKGPFGAALEGGDIHPPTISVAPMAPPDAWRPWNSPNHGGPGRGEGQNVLFADSHAEFQTKPCVGHSADNIYTQWGNDPSPVNAVASRYSGNPPTLGGCQTPASDTDSLIYP